MSAHTIAIAHHAGGVGKTTTTLNLGYALAAYRQRVLLVDLDPQADLMERLGEYSDSDVLARALLGGEYALAKMDMKYRDWPERDGTLWYVPSSLTSMVSVELLLGAAEQRENRLYAALSALQGDFDYILLDCPPNLSLLTVNALYAADSVLVPVQAQDKAVRQVPIFLGTLHRVQRYRMTAPRLLGLVLTMADPRESQTTLAQRDLSEAYGTDLFRTQIPRRTAIAADSRYQAPIAVYDADNAAAVAYAKLALEVHTRAKIA